MTYRIKGFQLPILLMAMFVFVSCQHEHKHDEDEVYEVDIAYLSPAEDAILPLNQPVEIRIKFSRPENKTIHHINVTLLDAAGNVIDVIDSGHKHTAGAYEVQDHSFVPTTKGNYLIIASTTDDQEENENRRQLNFFVD